MGSSAISNSGSLAIAIAITTRWRIPPDSSCGYRRAISAGSGRPTAPSSSTARCQAAPRCALRCSRTHSATCQPTWYIGFSAVIGSWNTIAIRSPRTDRHFDSLPPISSSPSSLIEPLTWAASGCRPSSDSASIVFPEPDSPTIPIVSPASMARLMPRTASIVPLSVGIAMARSST